MTTTDIAPTGSVRWCGLPYADSQELGSADILDALRELQHCEVQEHDARPAAVDALHSLVPSLQKGPERYGALDLKRALHRGIDAAEIRGLEDLPDIVAAPTEVAFYLTCRHQLLDARARFASAVGDAESAAGRALRDHLKTGDFGRAVALLNPRLFLSTTDSELCEPRAKSTRTLTAYFAQATRKTSPMSYLGIQAPTRVMVADNPTEIVSEHPAGVRSCFQPNQSKPDVAFVDESILECVQPASSNDVQQAPGWLRAHGLGPDRSRKVAEQVLDLVLYADDLALLQGRNVADACQLLAKNGMQDEQARAWIEYLVLSGVVAVVDPTSASHADQHLPTEPLRRAEFISARGEAQVERQPAGYENVIADATPVALPEGLSADLRQFVLDRRILHPVYRWSKKNFLDWYGPDERVRADDFITRSYVDYGFTGTAKEAVGENIYDQSTAASDVPDLPVVYTAFLQPVPAEQGGGFVLNRLLAGIFVGSNRTGDDQGIAAIRDWLHGSCVEGDLVELAVGDQWLPLQRLTGLAPTLTTDAAPSDLSLCDVLVSYDDNNNRLRLEREDGTPITAMYTGFIPPLLLPGPAGQLCALAQPVALQSSDDFDNIVTGATRPHVPRERSGQLITRRASWLIKASDIPESSPDSAAYLRSWIEVLEAAGAPSSGFLYIVPKENPARTPRKPLVYDVSSPHFMAAIESSLGKARQRDIVLVESLPSPPTSDGARVKEIVLLGVAHV